MVPDEPQIYPGRSANVEEIEGLYTPTEDRGDLLTRKSVTIYSVSGGTIVTKEARDIASVDIPGAFMQADMDETVHIRLEGSMAELLVKLHPKLYRMYTVNENGKPVRC